LFSQRWLIVLEGIFLLRMTDRHHPNSTWVLG
jgi:hypothetical protein